MVVMKGQIPNRERLLWLVDQMLSLADDMEAACEDDSCRVLAGIVRDAAFKIMREARSRGGHALGVVKKGPS